MKSLKIFLCISAAVLLCVLAAGCVAPAGQQIQPPAANLTADLNYNDFFTYIETELSGRLVNTSISYADVNGAHLAYREFGSAENEPLILIMGYTGVMDKWSGEFVYSLAEDYHVYIYDHRGMGYSTDDGAEYAFIRLADDCVGLMRSLGYEKFNVLGHSMGSVLTQVLLTEYSANISKGVIVSTIPDIYYPGAEDLKNTVINAAAYKGTTPDGVYRESVALIGYQGVFDELKNVTNDVMVLVGTEDTVTPVQGSVDVAAEISGAWLVQFKNCSHRIWSEIPLRSSEIVKTFLKMNETYTP
ncbi:MAG: alpha/beta hydrolase [Methanocorpusculum sp.]|nr:alpha/beta hydrolase [Methanocorpusculum sp.]